MMNCLKEKMTQQNIALFLFVAFFWLYIAKIGVYNGVVIATTLWGIYFCVHNRTEVWQYFKESSFIYIFGLLFIPIVISACFSVLPKDSWKTVLNFSRFFFIAGLIILFNLSALNKVRYGVLAFIILIALDATVEWLTGYHLTGVSRDRNRIMGLFQFYHLGYVLATLTPIIFYQTILSFMDKQKSKYFWSVISMCSVLAIFVAGARAGVITLLVSLGLIVLWLIVQRKVSLKIVLTSLVVLAVIGIGISQIPTVKNRYINPYQETEKVEIGSYEWFDKLSSARLVLWEFAWKQYRENPIIGAGTGTFHQEFSSQPKELKRQHDEAFFPHFHGLEVLSQTGALGFICYLLAVSAVLVMLLTAKQFSVWLTVAFLAMMPINLHVAFYGSFWAVLIWMPLILGLRERYLLMQKDPVNA